MITISAALISGLIILVIGATFGICLGYGVGYTNCSILWSRVRTRDPDVKPQAEFVSESADNPSKRVSNIGVYLLVSGMKEVINVTMYDSKRQSVVHSTELSEDQARKLGHLLIDYSHQLFKP